MEERKRDEASQQSNDWDERMAREEMLACRITKLIQRVNVPQVGFLRRSSAYYFFTKQLLIGDP